MRCLAKQEVAKDRASSMGPVDRQAFHLSSTRGTQNKLAATHLEIIFKQKNGRWRDSNNN